MEQSATSSADAVPSFRATLWSEWCGWFKRDGWHWLVGVVVVDGLKALALLSFKAELGKAEIPVFIAGLILFVTLAVVVYIRAAGRLWRIERLRADALAQRLGGPVDDSARRQAHRAKAAEVLIHALDKIAVGPFNIVTYHGSEEQTRTWIASRYASVNAWVTGVRTKLREVDQDAIAFLGLAESPTMTPQAADENLWLWKGEAESKLNWFISDRRKRIEAYLNKMQP